MQVELVRKDHNIQAGCGALMSEGYWFYLKDGKAYHRDKPYPARQVGETCSQPSRGYKSNPLIKFCKECSKDARGALVKAGVIW